MKVLAVAAISLDGMIGFDHVRQIETSPTDKAHFEKTTRAAGTIITGRNTLEAMKEPLADRRNIVLTRKPELLKIEAVPELEYTDEDPEAILKRLEQQHVDTVAVVGGAQIFTLFAPYTDEWHLTVCPQFVGEGIPLLDPFPTDKLKLLRREDWDTGETLLVLQST